MNMYCTQRTEIFIWKENYSGGNGEDKFKIFTISQILLIAVNLSFLMMMLMTMILSYETLDASLDLLLCTFLWTKYHYQTSESTNTTISDDDDKRRQSIQFDVMSSV